MKILSTSQIREADKYTIENEPISSIDLMERASKACFDQIKRQIKKQDKIKVFCGLGNNGGDGLAIARMLVLSGFDVVVFKMIFSENVSPDFAVNEKRYCRIQKAVISDIHDKTQLPDISESDIIIDAMFGSGLNRPLDGFAAEAVKHINNSRARIISIDLPSGLYGEDNTGNIPGHIIKAGFTYSFQLPKLAFMFPENHQNIGDWQVLNIGLNQEFINQQDSPYHFLLAEDLKPFFRYRNKFDHKGLHGHGLLIAGSFGKSGAAVLASRAALNMGIGLLTTHVPRLNYTIQQSSLPEGMVSVDEDENCFSGVKNLDPFTAIGIGPGIGKEKLTQNALKLLIQNYKGPIVLDADALNILAENPTWLSFLPPGSILTPHVGELERLTGKSSNGWERLEKAKDLAFRFNCYVVLKGAHTAIVLPDRQVIFNSTGNPGMAKGGSGDVLAGMILGLLAQGYTPMYSAMAGVYLHGMAGDIAARKKGIDSYLAGDIIDHIPNAIKKTFYV